MLQLAVAASEHAALSARWEIYPRGLSAERALALAQGTLVCAPGSALTAEEVRRNVATRYPEAQPLPGRPELDRLLEGLSSDLRWKADAADGKGGYEPTYRESPTFETSRPLATRLPTQFTIQPGAEVIRVVEHRLVPVDRHGVAVITRFDRADGGHVPFLSGASLLGLSRGEPGAYTLLADAIRQFGHDVAGDLGELWRRLLFSLLASNYDDHLRNHGFLMHQPGRWSLSPAYDLNPVPEIDRVSVSKTPISEDHRRTHHCRRPGSRRALWAQGP